MVLRVTFHGITCRARADMGRPCACVGHHVDSLGLPGFSGWFTTAVALRVLRPYQLPEWMSAILSQTDRGTEVATWEVERNIDCHEPDARI